MSKGLRLSLQFVMLLLVCSIAYFGWKTVNEPINFKKDRDRIYAANIAKLREIRDAQIAFKDRNNRFAGNWDELISFIDTGKYIILEKRDIEKMVTEKGLTFPKVITIIDTLGYVPLKDSTFKNYKGKSFSDINPLRYLAGTTQEFHIEDGYKVKEDTVSGITVVDLRFVVSASKKDLLTPLKGEYDDFYLENEESAKKGILGSELRIGSLEVNSVEGNWPKSFDELTDKLHGERK